MVDLRSTIRLRTCPALECRHSTTAPRQITAEEFPEIHAKLERMAAGHPYDYYHCDGWCKRIWRIERYDPRKEPYQQPQWIGYWDPLDMKDGPDAKVYETGPQEITLAWQFLCSKADPTRPARNQRDAVHY